MEQVTLYYNIENKSKTAPLFSDAYPVIRARKHITPSYPDCSVTAVDRILCFKKKAPSPKQPAEKVKHEKTDRAAAKSWQTGLFSCIIEAGR